MPTPFTTQKLTLRQAATFYAANQAAASQYICLRILARVGASRKDEDELSEEMRASTPLTSYEFAEMVSWGNALAEDLRLFLTKGDLLAKGFLPGSIDHLSIPADWWRGATLDLERNAATANGTTLTGLVITPPEALQRAPIRGANSEAYRRRSGGRPSTHNWADFRDEVLRFVELDAPRLDLSTLRKRMKDWAELNMQPAPDDRTIEKKIAELLPADLIPA
jgi:hypothetical protein